MGHAFIDLYELSIPTGEEDAADGLSAYIILEYYEDQGFANNVIRDAAFAYLLQSSLDLPIEAYADTHSLSIQRYFDLACFAYGKDPSANRDLIQAGLLTSERARGCDAEYAQLLKSCDDLL